MPKSTISVAITTHNRLDDLCHTLSELKRYDGQFLETIVCADGCSDGTESFLESTYPDFIRYANSPGKGSIPSRNRMIRESNADLVLLLDDDSYPLESDFIAKAVALMDANPSVGVLTFPQRSDEFPETLTQEDFGKDQIVGTFTSSGSVIRKSLFLEIGGFPDYFFHAYEEPDYSLRVIARGFEVYLCNQITVRHHFTTAMRNEGRTHRRHARNESWSTIMRAPSSLLLPVFFYRVISQMKYAAKRGIDWVIKEPEWWWQSFKKWPLAWKNREPVNSSSYKKWIQLMRNPEAVMESPESIK